MQSEIMDAPKKALKALALALLASVTDAQLHVTNSLEIIANEVERISHQTTGNPGELLIKIQVSASGGTSPPIPLVLCLRTTRDTATVKSLLTSKRASDGYI
tara:strand:+ start:219 stop:524 length:306 start_codon:yes stop_codon:yes gene_type:complete